MQIKHICNTSAILENNVEVIPGLKIVFPIYNKQALLWGI